jgi:hypothetical protein
MVVEKKVFKNVSFHSMSEGYKCCLEDEEEELDSRTSLFTPGENDRE